VAMRNPWRADMDEELDRLCRLRMDADGKFQVADVLNDFQAWLTAHPQVVQGHIAKIARDCFDGYDKRRRPSGTGAQFGLFRPECLIPTGKNERVFMELATREDLISWGAIDDQEFADSATAHAKKSAYRAERLRQWPAGVARLIDVERDVFGWSS
jgi:hypothetical protein